MIVSDEQDSVRTVKDLSERKDAITAAAIGELWNGVEYKEEKLACQP